MLGWLHSLPCNGGRLGLGCSKWAEEMRGSPPHRGSPGPSGSRGKGVEVPLQPSECEPGLAGAGVPRHRGGRRKREPTRKEEAEMGEVRESRECGQQGSQAGLGPRSQSGQGWVGVRGQSWREPEGRGARVWAQPPPILARQTGGRLRPERRGLYPRPLWSAKLSHCS